MNTSAFLNRLETFLKSDVRLGRLAKNIRSIYRKSSRGYKTFPGIPGRIHYNDNSFYKGPPGHYISVGRSALENIEHALRLSGRTFQDIGKCLDFPCGYGRIARFLQPMLPQSAAFDVCDIVPEAIGFCAEEFGATPLLSQEDISKLVLPKMYDLIWIGSLLTHLDKDRFYDTLKTASESLEEEGVLIFTTHGSFSLDILDSYGIPDLNKKEAETALLETGFYFAPYSGKRTYGISLSSEDFVRSLLKKYFLSSLKLLFFKPRGWDDHQDVYACEKIRSP